MKLTKREKLVSQMVTTFGGIELDKEEQSFLALGPDFTMFDDLKMEEFEKEIQITATKIRWSRMNRETEDIKNMRDLT